MAAHSFRWQHTVMKREPRWWLCSQHHVCNFPRDRNNVNELHKISRHMWKTEGIWTLSKSVFLYNRYYFHLPYRLLSFVLVIFQISGFTYLFYILDQLINLNLAICRLESAVVLQSRRWGKLGQWKTTGEAEKEEINPRKRRSKESYGIW